MTQLPIPESSTLFDKMTDAVYLMDPTTARIMWSNRAGHLILGMDAQEVRQHSALVLQKEIVNMQQWREVVELVKRRQSHVFITRHAHKNGADISLEVCMDWFEDQGHGYILATARDITRRLALERKLHDRNYRLWFVFHEASDGMWDWDIPTARVTFSPQLKRILGYAPEEMDPTLETWIGRVHPEDVDDVMTVMRDHLEGRRENYECEYRLCNRNGHYIWVHDRGKICERDAEGAPRRVIGMVQNISDRKKMEFALEALAHHDVLTGLPNRRRAEDFLNEQLQQSFNSGLEFCLGILDLDFFKKVNDVYGHQKGDEVLQYAAKILRDNLRSTDFVSRWGGEEFVLIFPGASLENASHVVNKLRTAFAEGQWQEELEVPPVTFSMGLAHYPDHHRSATGLLREADRALYRAKSAGRDRFEVAVTDSDGSGEPPVAVPHTAQD